MTKEGSHSIDGQRAAGQGENNYGRPLNSPWEKSKQQHQKSAPSLNGGKPSSFLSSIPPPGLVFSVVHALLMLASLIGYAYSSTQKGWGALALLCVTGGMAAVSLLCLAGKVKGIRGLGLLGSIAGVIGSLWLSQVSPFFAFLALFVYCPSVLSVLSAMHGQPEKKLYEKNEPEITGLASGSEKITNSGFKASDSKSDKAAIDCDKARRPGSYPLALVLLALYCLVELVRLFPMLEWLLPRLMEGFSQFFNFGYIIMPLGYIVLPLGILFFLWRRNRQVVLIFLLLRILLPVRGIVVITTHFILPATGYGALPDVLNEYYPLILRYAYTFLIPLALFLIIISSRRIANFFK